MTTLAHEQPATATHPDPYLECKTLAAYGPPTVNILDSEDYSTCPRDLQLYLRAITGDITDFTDPCFHLSDEAKEVIADEISFLQIMQKCCADAMERDKLRFRTELLMTAYLMCQRGDAPDRTIMPEAQAGANVDAGPQPPKTRHLTQRVLTLLHI